MQSLWLIIVVFFLLIFIIPILTKLHLSYDIIHNIGTFSLYIYFIKVFAYKIRIKDKNITIITEENAKEIETTLSNKQMRFLQQLNSQLKQKLIVRKITIYSRIGLKDASLSAIVTGLFNAVAGAILGYIKNIKKSARICVKSEPDYNGEHFTFAVYGSFAITLLDILYAFIMSFVITKRGEKYEGI